MDTFYAKQLVELLLDYQFDMLWRENCWGVNHAEFLFVETTRVITEHPDLRTWFIGLVEASMESNAAIDGSTVKRPTGYIPHEFMFFFVHFTRWPEFARLSERMRDSDKDVWRSNLLTRWSESIEDALLDSWEDRDMYRTFSAEG